MSEIYTDPPQSRNEAIIRATIDGTQYTAPPQSRMEDLLLELKKAIEQGGGGGTKDYEALDNKPSINDVELSGNKTASDLGLMPEYEVDTTPTEDSENLITSGGVWSADKNIKDKLQGSKTAGSTDGSPIEIPDYGMTESIDMYFKPTQDLHGYDKPWAGGAGKNKFPSEWETGTIDPNTGRPITSDGFWRVQKVEVETDTNYYISFVGTIASASDFRIFTYDENGNFISVLDTAYPTTISTTGVRYISFRWPKIYNLTDLQLEEGSTATAYEPYANICPISGQDNATFEWTGKNLFDEIYPDINAGVQYKAIYVGDGTFTMSTTTPTTPTTATNLFFLTGNVSSGASTDANGVSQYVSRTITSTNGYVTVGYRNAESVDPNNYKTQIEKGDQATAYARYVHGEVSMNFGNTYYGGYCQFDGEIYPDWDYIASYNGETLSGEWVSDRDEYVAGTTPTIGAEVAYKTTPSYVRVTPPANLNLTDDYPIEYNGYMANISYQPKNTVLAEAKRYTNQEIAKLGFPQAPTTDGTYHLECSVSGGIPTIRWVSNS